MLMKNILLSISWYGIRVVNRSKKISFPFTQPIFPVLQLMATETTSPTILNTNEPNQTLVSINVAAQTPLKLNSTNYHSWNSSSKLSFIGYDLLGYVDGSNPCSPTTITKSNTTNQIRAMFCGPISVRISWSLMQSLAPSHPPSFHS